MANDTPPPFPPPQKKGLHPVAWAGIGCGSLVIIFGVLFVIFAIKASKTVLKAFNEHPARHAVDAVLKEYPAISRENENTETGTLSLRSFDTIPTDYDQLLHGKVRFSDPMGATVPAFPGDLSKAPAWVPRYPGATGEVSLLHQESPTRIRGIIVADTTDSKEAIDTFFEAQATKLFGISTSGKSSTEINGKRSLRMSYSGGKRELKIYAYGMPGAPMTMVIVYTEEK